MSWQSSIATPAFRAKKTKRSARRASDPTPGKEPPSDIWEGYYTAARDQITTFSSHFPLPSKKIGLLSDQFAILKLIVRGKHAHSTTSTES
jgi:hypothetical protein